MEDVKFHQCVRLSRFENDRTISFIPPDGEFELMSYRLNTQIKPLIWAEAVVERHEGSRIEFMVKVKAQFKRRSTANNVEIFISVPEDADSPKFRVCFVQTDPGCNRIGDLCARAVCDGVEDQTIGRRQGIPHACAFWSAQCSQRYVHGFD